MEAPTSADGGARAPPEGAFTVADSPEAPPQPQGGGEGASCGAAGAEEEPAVLMEVDANMTVEEYLAGECDMLVDGITRRAGELCATLHSEAQPIRRECEGFLAANK